MYINMFGKIYDIIFNTIVYTFFFLLFGWVVFILFATIIGVVIAALGLPFILFG